MTKTGLMEYIQNEEDSGVEFKRDSLSNAAFAKELAAL